ncbi:MAG: uroporphyrinogen decarboxylase family protein [Dehalococcoidales bacterium]
MVISTETTETPWAELTPDEKMEQRLAAWLAAKDVEFTSQQAEADYKARITRIIDSIKLKKPDRVPIIPRIFSPGFPAVYCGYTQKDLMYDVDKAIEAANRCTLDFQFDTKVSASAPQGRVMELLDDKQRKWPGHGVPDNSGTQFIEGEYMKADEYDDFILDESNFRWRTYLPRIWGAAEPLGQLSLDNARSLGIPEVQTALKKLMEAGKEARRWEGKIAAVNRKLTEAGYPDMLGSAAGLGGAPFDRMGDNLRGQRGIALDLYQRPEKLLEAIDVLTKKRLLQIRKTSEKAKLGGSPIVGFALHKGADGFMSDEQFRTFYWPSLRQICLALIEEGFVPQLRAQGGYNSRLEAVRDLPKGKVIWWFDSTDMERAKEVLGDRACIQGNVPMSLISTGTPEETDAYCRHLIDTAGKNGGFMLSTGAGLDSDSKVENVRAMVKTAKEYGIY